VGERPVTGIIYFRILYKNIKSYFALYQPLANLLYKLTKVLFELMKYIIRFMNENISSAFIYAML
jgi:hypothetical protein